MKDAQAILRKMSYIRDVFQQYQDTALYHTKRCEVLRGKNSEQSAAHGELAVYWVAKSEKHFAKLKELRDAMSELFKKGYIK